MLASTGECLLCYSLFYRRASDLFGLGFVLIDAIDAVVSYVEANVVISRLIESVVVLYLDL